MTGEISLVGQVLPVGGLKEKILAAHRGWYQDHSSPRGEPRGHRRERSESVKTGIKFVYVEDVKEVLHEVFQRASCYWNGGRTVIAMIISNTDLPPVSLHLEVLTGSQFYLANLLYSMYSSS